MARRVPPDDGDRGADDTGAAVRVPGAGVGAGLPLPHGDGGRHLLLLPPHVQGAGALREGRPPPHPLPRARRRRPRSVTISIPPPSRRPRISSTGSFEAVEAMISTCWFVAISVLRFWLGLLSSFGLVHPKKKNHTFLAF